MWLYISYSEISFIKIPLVFLGRRHPARQQTAEGKKREKREIELMDEGVKGGEKDREKTC